MPGLVLALILTKCVHLGIHLISLGLILSSIKEEGWIRLDVLNLIFQPGTHEGCVIEVVGHSV